MPQHLNQDRRNFGLRAALSMFWHRRRAMIGYLVLALAVSYALYLERQHSNSNRSAATEITRNILITGCQHNNNELRGVLRHLLLDEKPLILTAVKQHRITLDQAQDNFRFIDTELSKIQDIDCQQLYSGIR